MLGKLIKYEFSAVTKIYVPIYALVLILATINKVLMVIMPNNNINLPQGILMIAYIIFLTALIAITFITGILRFKKNLLNDEGYLMLTLPVARWQLILAKIISAVFFTIICVVVGITSIFILTWSKTSTFTFTFHTFESGIATTFLVLLIIVILFGMMAGYLSIYLALSIGHMSNSTNKLAMSVLAFFVIGLITNIIFISIIFTGIKFSYLFENISFALLPLVILGILAVCMGVYDVICFFGTSYILKNKLNLE